MKKLIRILSVCVLLSSCAGVRKLSPQEQARLDAQDAILQAKEMIKTCQDEEIDTSEPETLLKEAEDLFQKKEYGAAEDKARVSYELAKKLLDEVRAARKKALEEAEKEAASKPPTSYTVGTWAKNRDCLWNIAKKSEIYDDPWQWKKIYLANKSEIKDPDLIYPGQVFKIPR
ncbi:MAG: LysM peptidoglycan-binding domain-containing protein [Elusimicrobia bacterium]|nr:LysM peptidoglycan-binding domain-containing protein [Elusimicrobiota bacterium]